MGEKGHIRGVVLAAFAKAEKESHHSTPHALCSYLSDEVDLPISSRTLNRYYKCFVQQRGVSIQVGRDTLDVLSRYLGHDGFVDFVQHQRQQNPQEEQVAHQKEAEDLFSAQVSNSKAGNQKRNGIIMATTGLLGALGLTFGVLTYDQKDAPECMQWSGDRYVVVPCEGQPHTLPLDEEVVQSFRKIEVCDTTTFFKNNRAQVWYLKRNNQYDFFTAPELHPIYRVTLKEVSPYIVKNRVPACGGHTRNDEK